MAGGGNVPYNVFRVVLGVLLIALIIITIVQIISEKGSDTWYIIMAVLLSLTLVMGLIGVWKENLLFSIICSVVLGILFFTGIFMITFATLVPMLILLILMIVFCVILANNGKADMSLPFWGK